MRGCDTGAGRCGDCGDTVTRMASISHLNFDWSSPNSKWRYLPILE